MAGTLLAGMLCACSSSGDGFGSEAPEPISPSLEAPQTLHIVDVAGGRHEFQSVDLGSEHPVIAVLSSLGPDGIDPMSALFAQHGPLTMFEFFLAVAEPGVAPHPSLIRSHAGEAIALGRVDATVQEVRFESNPATSELEPIVDKALPPDFEARCRSQLFPAEPDRVWTRTEVLPSSSSFLGDDYYMCAGGDEGFWVDRNLNVCAPTANSPSRPQALFTQALRVGMCHLDPASPALQVEFWGATTGALSRLGSATLRSTDTPTFFTLPASSVAKRLAVVRRSPVDSARDVMGTGVGERP